jgi:hypothetical protein
MRRDAMDLDLALLLEPGSSRSGEDGVVVVNVHLRSYLLATNWKNK